MTEVDKDEEIRRLMRELQGKQALLNGAQGDAERFKTVVRRQDAEIERLKAELAARGPWPKAPEGARVAPPSYEMHPFSVSYVFGAGWGLFRQLPASGASAKVSHHDSAQSALAAMVEAHRAHERKVNRGMV